MMVGSDAQNTDQKQSGIDLEISAVLANVGVELQTARNVCVNLEEIFADRLLKTADQNNFVRQELQNLDRLIQLISDIGSAALFLSDQVGSHQVNSDDLRSHIKMKDLFGRLSGKTQESVPKSRAHGSDMTFF